MEVENEFGKILSGTAVSKEIQEDLTLRVKILEDKVADFQPGLAIVQVGGREDSNVYIRTKIKAAAAIGIKAEHIQLPKTVTQVELLSKINKLNNDPSVHGIIVQMPLDCVNEIDSHLVTDSVSPEKDVDGLNTINEGRVAVGDMSGFIPCTPNGVMELIKRSGINISGSQAVVLGRSKIVGTPAAELLKWHNATVTVCHSRTKDLEKEVSKADILVVAIGKAEFVKGSWIKRGAVVIDCGINYVADSTKKSGKRLVGDVAYSEATSVASYITPVPGGVGPMTVCMLMTNTVVSAERYINKLLSTSWSLSTLPLVPLTDIPSDIDISRSQEPKDITILASEIGIFPNELSPFGYKKAKVSLNILKRLKSKINGKYIVVTGMTPTPLGEGKSTTTIGLAQALCAHRRKNAIACIRQPSQGPTFGIKGGAAGGGYSQVIPMEEFNLHLTGDIHAVTAAHNLLAAQLDARMFHEHTQSDKALYERLVPTIKGERKFSQCQLRRLKKLGIDKTVPNSLTDSERSLFSRLNISPPVSWGRVMDINDRFLRKITIGQSPTERGFTRETSFTISVASEIMAILALSSDLEDMKRRLANIIVAYNKDGAPVTAEDLGMTGAMCVLLKDAIEPTLMQTFEGTPVLIHAGPFANIAHGCSSIIADAIGLKLVGSDGYVITEAGFGSDIGLEKFVDIKCRYSRHLPNAAVLVVTVRAIKMHGGGSDSYSNIEYLQENISLLQKGISNLMKHIDNCHEFNIPVVVAINAHLTDTPREHELIKEYSLRQGAKAVAVCTHWSEGGKGAVDLADMVISACQGASSFRFLYPFEESLITKLEIIAKKMYGASHISMASEVAKKFSALEEQGFGTLPICMAKTPMSLTGDPALKGAPLGFTLVIHDAILSAGAAFIIAMAGQISTMPGLPTRPCIYDIELDTETGLIHGLM